MKRRKDTPAQIKRSRARFRALSKPITLEQILAFDLRLVPVSYASGTCWIYPSKSAGGASQSYGRMKFNGVLIMTHRFALAVKLGCTLWDLEGYEASHSSKVVCQGGRCCNPEHLTSKQSDPNRSWDRAKDAKKFGDKVVTRTALETKAMMQAMYPNGITIAGRTLDDPSHATISPPLLRFLEMGHRQELENMRRDRKKSKRPVITVSTSS